MWKQFYPLLTCLTLAACFLAPCAGRADEPEPIVPPKVDLPPLPDASPLVGLIPEDVLGKEDAIPAELQDPVFDRYVDLRLVREALASQDPVLLTDVALQMAEGERILLRPHKALPAKKLLNVAVQVAADKKDKAALERLAKAAKAIGNEELAGQIDIAQKMAQAPRKANYSLTYSVDQISPEGLVLFRTFADEIRSAKNLGNRSSLDQIEIMIPRLVELSGQQRGQLTKMLKDAKATLPEKADSQDRMLLLLAQSSRRANPSKR